MWLSLLSRVFYTVGQGLVHIGLLLPNLCFTLLQLEEAVRLGAGKWRGRGLCNPGTKEAEAGASQTEGQHGPTQRELREIVTDPQNEVQQPL